MRGGIDAILCSESDEASNASLKPDSTNQVLEAEDTEVRLRFLAGDNRAGGGDCNGVS